MIRIFDGYQSMGVPDKCPRCGAPKDYEISKTMDFSIFECGSDAFFRGEDGLVVLDTTETCEETCTILEKIPKAKLKNWGDEIKPGETEVTDEDQALIDDLEPEPPE